jgi:hypothetical protein
MAEMAANASLVRPLALVGAKLTTCIAETFAAVPPRRPYTSEEVPPVKPLVERSTALIFKRRRAQKTWTSTTTVWTKAKI